LALLKIKRYGGKLVIEKVPPNTKTIAEPVIEPIFLTVKTTPANARVRILNIKPKYQAGIRLQVGKNYTVEVTQRGYQRQLKTVSYSESGQQAVNIALVKLAEKIEPKISSKPSRQTTAARYRDQGDGTVMDNHTGLQWMRCSLGQKWRGNTCEGKANRYKWQAALDKAEDYRYAGHGDWRMPTIQELNTLVYCSNGKTRVFKKGGYGSITKEGDWGCGSDTRGAYQRPTIFTKVFPNTSSNRFWSSSPNATNSNDAWVVNFNYGSVSNFFRTVNVYVRLVR